MMPRLTDAHPFVDLSTCQLCGVVADDQVNMFVWYECDEWDKPEPGRVLVTCKSKGCQRIVEKHPRLYVAAETGLPGHFRLLCAKCLNRDGIRCTHPKLKANGGEGLRVGLSALSGIVCTRGHGCHPIPRLALDCEGQQLPGEIKELTA